MTWWMWLVCAAIGSAALEVLRELHRETTLIISSAIDRFDEAPKMQMSSVLGHVPDRGTDAAGDGGRGEDAAAGACPAAQSRD